MDDEVKSYDFLIVGLNGGSGDFTAVVSAEKDGAFLSMTDVTADTLNVQLPELCPPLAETTPEAVDLPLDPPEAPAEDTISAPAIAGPAEGQADAPETAEPEDQETTEPEPDAPETAEPDAPVTDGGEG